MRNGQVTSRDDGYGLATHGTRAPVQWLIGTDGWALFIRCPWGELDLRDGKGRFVPRKDRRALEPLDRMTERQEMAELGGDRPEWEWGPLLPLP